MLLAFKGNPPSGDMTVDHINRIKHDNRLENLRWATPKEQIANSTYFHNSASYKKVEQRSLDGTLIKIWDSRIEAAKSLGLDARRISEACLGVKKGNVYNNFIWINPVDTLYEYEIWKPCVYINFEGFYVSSLGRIRTKNGKIIFGSNNKEYLITSVRVNGIKITRAVHCLVAEAFLGSSDLLVNHKDGNKSNNRIENLEYVTYQENAHNTGLHPGNKTRPVIQYDLNGNEIARFDIV